MNEGAVELADAIGDTPLLRLPSLSLALGRTILAKAEHLNPGGSIKDRPARYIIDASEKEGRLRAGGTIVEASAGNTGIALAMLAAARGYRCVVTVPDDQSAEKIDVLRLVGADVRFAPIVPFTDERHFYHAGRRIADETQGAVWADQFNNLANFRSHYEGTGPEIWRQTHGGELDAFVCASGTGGTIAGITRALKERRQTVRTILADPMGSALFAYVRTDALIAEGESIVEGIGIKRITENFAQASIDDAVRIDDRTAVEMLYYLLRREGLFVGGSSALNVAAAAKVALAMPENSVVVTILCDGGARYLSRLWNPAWLAEQGLTPRATALEFL